MFLRNIWSIKDPYSSLSKCVYIYTFLSSPGKILSPRSLDSLHYTTWAGQIDRPFIPYKLTCINRLNFNLHFKLMIPGFQTGRTWKRVPVPCYFTTEIWSQKTQPTELLSRNSKNLFPYCHSKQCLGSFHIKLQGWNSHPYLKYPYPLSNTMDSGLRSCVAQHLFKQTWGSLGYRYPESVKLHKWDILQTQRK